MVEKTRPPNTSVWDEWFVRVPAFIILAAVIVALLAFIIGQWSNPVARQIVFDHLRATVGLPIAGVFAFLIVALFRSTEGQIKFSLVGVTFEGAAGPIVMWVFCFLAIAGSIKMLWG